MLLYTMNIQLLKNFCSFSRPRALFSTSPPNLNEVSGPKPTASPDQGIRRLTPKLSDFYKRVLVFSGKYKSLKEVPDAVPIEVFERGRSRARVKLANYLMFLTLAGCLSFAYLGRTASQRGESVSQMNLDWHKDYNEKMAEEYKKKNEKN